MDRDPPRKPDSRTCEPKALWERDLCMCILKMCTEAMHKRMGQSAREQNITSQCADPDCDWEGIFAMHVNARSSNHDPNHVLDRNPKSLLERDSSPCEHSH